MPSEPQPDLVERVYSPAPRLAHPVAFLRTLFADLWASRGLAWRLFLRNLRAKYRGSLLGYLWAILPPLVGMLVWVFLNGQILDVGETPVPYPLYVLLGTTLWSLFLASLRSPINAVKGARSMLTRVAFPSEALILSGLASVAFNFSLQLIPIVGVYWWCGVSAPVALAWVPLCLLALCGFGLALGLLLVPLATLYKDIPRIVNTGLGVLFFLTPVVYPPPTEWPLSLVSTVNPISPFIVVTRDLATRGETALLNPFLGLCGATVVLLFGGWILFRLSMPYLVERMSA